VSTFDCDGATLWYETLGRGDLLIALHGGLGLDHTCLRPWLDPLAEDVNLTYFDFRANGRSTGEAADLTMHRLAQDVDALRRHLGRDRTWLLGHSYGGFVALQYALSFPEHLSGLILMDTDSTGPRPDTIMEGLQRLGVAPEQMGAFETQVESTEDMFALFDTLGPWYLPHSEPGTARSVLGRTIYRKEGDQGGEHALDGWDVTTQLTPISAPALVLTGNDDFMFPPASAQRLADALPNGTARIIEASGHLPFVEANEATLTAVCDFLSNP
jgi:proline iminopeptidase